MKRLFFLLFTILLFQFASAQLKAVKLKIMHTTDVHGSYFPYNFMTEQQSEGSLARVSTFIKSVRKTYHHNAILLDNGDILQGQPTSYYYNYIDTTDVHLCASMMNSIGYDAGNLGNHDVETGMNVFSRWSNECHFPILCANAVVKATGKPLYKPYEIFVRDGVKIAVLAMITPCIPCWLSESLYPGIRFDDMEATAQKWIPIIKSKENPDIIVGLFHSGIEAETLAGLYREDASREVAEHIPGFDIVMAGHDHQQYCLWIKNIAGKSVLVINPGKDAINISNIDITAWKNRAGAVVKKSIIAKLTPMAGVEPDKQFVSEYTSQFDTLKQFVSKKLGVIDRDVNVHDAFFGPSAFVDAIHTVQLELTGADISFAAPFSYNAIISKGDFTVSDLFNLYKFENKIYVMHLTGQEVKNYLEYSYGLWFNTMRSEGDDLFVVRNTPGGKQFKNPIFNFDSAAGIVYTVDVSKPIGSKITILKMANGEPFRMDKVYDVVLNSYRGNGGGDLLTKGAGIDRTKLKDRLIFSSDKEFRYYLMKFISDNGTSFFQPRNEWEVIPKTMVDTAMKRNYNSFFNYSAKKDIQ
jgi:2',3'-cyclic-nucleotide 2'-phosphodiesterase/3'-nucleotidase